MEQVHEVFSYMKGDGFPPGASANDKRNIRRHACNNYKVGSYDYHICNLPNISINVSLNTKRKLCASIFR